MNPNDTLRCNGLETKDKQDWDGEYPYFEPTRLGFKVRLSAKTSLPGLFTDYVRAERAYKQYEGRRLAAKAKQNDKKG